MANDDSTWHLDKRVNVSIIIALLIQFGAFIWAWSHMTYDIERLKLDLGRVENGRDGDQREQRDLEGRLIRLEEQTRNTLDTVKEIKGLLTGGRAGKAE
jgi:hypothetical protein